MQHHVVCFQKKVNMRAKRFGSKLPIELDTQYEYIYILYAQ